MNREIKFRVWNGDMMSEPFAPWEMVKDITGGWMNRDGVSLWWENGSAQWMQFTGLKDKNGKEIYEGDRVFVVIDQTIGEEFRGEAEVEWSDVGCWMLDFPNLGQSIQITQAEEIEVLGNIHQVAAETKILPREGA